ncbi:hypothetical protein GLW08_19670 [Pontibacillus yanchengensis]|uniref:Uncharacterized protein n=1 Tax=Pontibacillus yanchengensis TaxID=462910 RepID=A0ACC7VKM8_9BACI|nr:hypothetical protein [Pontibacillus yanchengensis]MYL55526.1 hypothetical protein [Pontibacillus yanchengensis]
MDRRLVNVKRKRDGLRTRYYGYDNKVKNFSNIEKRAMMRGNMAWMEEDL